MNYNNNRKQEFLCNHPFSCFVTRRNDEKPALGFLFNFNNGTKKGWEMGLRPSFKTLIIIAILIIILLKPVSCLNHSGQLRLFVI